MYENQQFWSRPGPTQLWLYSDSIKLEALNVGYKENYPCGESADQLHAVTQGPVSSFIFGFRVIGMYI